MGKCAVTVTVIGVENGIGVSSSNSEFAFFVRIGHFLFGIRRSEETMDRYPKSAGLFDERSVVSLLYKEKGQCS